MRMIKKDTIEENGEIEGQKNENEEQSIYENK